MLMIILDKRVNICNLQLINISKINKSFLTPFTDHKVLERFLRSIIIQLSKFFFIFIIHDFNE